MASDRHADSDSYQAIASLLPQVYDVLATIIDRFEVDSDYTQAIHRVLRSAQAAEQLGFPLTALPLLTCQAGGLTPHQALPVAASWRALHIGLKLLDDVEDGDVARMSDDPNDLAQVTNLSTGFLAIVNLSLDLLNIKLRTALQTDIARTLLQMAGGQHIDLSRRVMDVPSYFTLMAAKSGTFFALAARSGAMCATVRPPHLHHFEFFGYNVGMLLQIIDDLVGLRQPVGYGDLATGQRTLPIIYSLGVASPQERSRLEHLLLQAPMDGEAQLQAQQLMIMLGVEIYLLAEQVRYRQRALAELNALNQDYPVEPLRTWLKELEVSMN